MSAGPAGDGSAGGASGSASGDGTGITVTGGAGGTRARLDELEAIVRALRDAAWCLGDAERAHRRLTAEVIRRVGSGAASAALERLGGRRGLAPVADEAGSLAAAVQRTVRAYGDADADATQAMRAVTVEAARTLGESGPFGWVLAARAAVSGVWFLALARMSRWTPTPFGAAMRWLGSPAVAGRTDAWGAVGRLLAGPGVLPELPNPDRLAAEIGVASLAAFLTGALPGRAPALADPVPLGSWDALLLASPFLPATMLRVTPVGVERAEPPRDEADVLALVDEQYVGDGAVAGQVAVQRLDHADGSRSWVVAIPGTEEWTFGGANPLDGLSDLELVASAVDDVTRTVLRAMALAGIGTDEPVLLAGHSLGGIVAARIAATSDYRVVALLTAGSPVSGIPVPGGTAALHLEHAQDPVPGLRGLPNPDEVNRTTVVRDLGVPDPGAGQGSAGGVPVVGGSAGGVSAAHALSAYRRTAELLPGDDVSVGAFRDATGPVLGDDVVGATTWTFAGERVPLDADPAGRSVRGLRSDGVPETQLPGSGLTSGLVGGRRSAPR
ncbi:hypothetical protein OEB99_01230 [Actinotalea sp. M2MS4P-6]|uniref:hypothetical protein n=1 Tax=Actinotalea sp. M2MS4P-6 TaxID=2983762 RepID=UPI0021E3615C|nr:hypothetical protein [Actinotalea sp. M2MS4P-6]MCV2392918.1 hypothetical protein [Actinotalea sp. M2MS4P-6]